MIKTYKLPLSPNYVCDWGVVQGIRELLQNALDREDELDYEWSYSEENTHSLRITTSNVQLDQSLLLLGSSSKEDGDESRGMYGEGMKLAFLTLLREGLEVKCYNGAVLWTPYFAHCEDFDSVMLHVDETPNERGCDLTYIITGLDDEYKQEVIDSTLSMQGDYEKTDTSIGSILNGPEHSRKVFVGGLFVCKSDVKFGYDFHPDVMKLNRDRANIDGWDLKRETQKMHCEKTPAAKVAEMVSNQQSDVNYIQYHTSAVPEDVVEEVFKLHVKLNGDVPLANSATDLKQLKKDGYKDAVFLGNDGMTALVKKSHNYNPTPSEIVLTPKQILVEYSNNFENGMTDLAIEEFDKLISMSEDWE